MTIAEDPVARRRNDPEKTRQNILDVGTEEFALNGLSGARVDVIAARTHTTKRMIYYYFKDKEGLYKAVIEDAYRRIRRSEELLETERLTPVDAIRAIVEFSFNYHESNSGFTRLVTIENIHRARLLSEADIPESLNQSILARISAILDQGLEQGVFKRRVLPIDVHMLISSFCFYRVSNEHTFGHVHRISLRDPEVRARHLRMACDAVLAYLGTPG